MRLTTVSQSRQTSSLASLALVVGLLGCSGGDPSSASPVPPSEGPPADPAAIRRAQGAWAEIQAKKDDLAHIEDALVRKCLAGKGFDTFPATPSVSGASSGPEISPTLPEARSKGFGLDPRLVAGPTPSTDASENSWASTSDDYKARLTLAQFGSQSDVITYDTGDQKVAIPASGCAGEVRRQLYGDLKTYVRLSWFAGNQVRQQEAAYLKKDAKLAASQNQWAACMGTKGYTVQAHLDAVSQAYLFYNDSSAPTPDLNAARHSETEIATADAECAEQTAYRSEQLRARGTASVEVLGRNAEATVAWRDLVLAALDRGKKALNA
jgi:hypothetical protein